MKREWINGSLLLIGLLAAGAAGAADPAPSDWRLLSAGRVIPSGGSYADQPYLVRTRQGGWLCVVTTAQGREGSSTQTVAVTRTTDQGATWSAPAPLERPGGPEASYAVPYRTSYGRIYCFYNYNRDNVREVKREDSGVYTRVDSLGSYVFRYSDDDGVTWSSQRYEIPIREFKVDRENVYGGRIRFFWNVGRPLEHRGALLIPHHKVAAMGQGFFAQSEGAILRSPNILSERDPEKLIWQTLPDGETGLRTPAGGGRVAEEQSLASLSDGSLVCIYRSVDGHPVHAYSRDGGASWSNPEYLSYSPGGRLVKHPRAANFIWNCGEKRFLYWFHNHGGRAARENRGWDPYNDRNPGWLAAAREVRTPEGLKLQFSQPEICLYDDDPMIRMSYPDLLEDDGRFFLTETQKTTARVHELDAGWLKKLFAQFELRTVARGGILRETASPAPASSIPAVPLPPFVVRDLSRADHGAKAARAGFTLELALAAGAVNPGELVLDSRSPDGRGLLLRVGDKENLELVMSDGRQTSSWSSDEATLLPGKLTHLTLVVDGGPRVIAFVADGLLQDGGERRQFGWGRFSPHLRDVNSGAAWRIAPHFSGRVELLRIYGRALMISEAAGNYRAWRADAVARLRGHR